VRKSLPKVFQKPAAYSFSTVFQPEKMQQFLRIDGKRVYGMQEVWGSSPHTSIRFAKRE
jgi:hypothetical protein